MPESRVNMMDARLSLIKVRSGPEQECLNEIAQSIKVCIERLGGGHKEIIFLSDNDYGRDIAHFVHHAHPNAKYYFASYNWPETPSRTNGPENSFVDKHYDAIVILCPAERLHVLVRHAHHCFFGYPPIFAAVQGAPQIDKPTVEEINAGFGPMEPIVAFLYPGAGSARLNPVFSQLMKSRKRQFLPIPTRSLCGRFIDRYADFGRKLQKPLLGGNLTPLRKGISGDWKNNFSPKVCEIAKEMAGDALVELGYENDKNW